MSTKGRYFAQALGEFGQSIQQMGETIYKVDADNEATTLQLDIASQIEEFKQSLLTDSNAGNPLDPNGDGYMARWNKLSAELRKKADSAKNPLARQEVNNYLGKVLPAQTSGIAEYQFKGWADTQKAKTTNAILNAQKNMDAQSALNFAAAEYGKLLNYNIISNQDFSSLMNLVASPALEDALYKKAKEAYLAGGEAAASNVVGEESSVFTVPGMDQTFSYSQDARRAVGTRLSAFIAGDQAAEDKKIEDAMGNLLAYSRGEYDGTDANRPMANLDMIRTSRSGQKTTWYSILAQYEATGRTTKATAGELELSRGYLLLMKKQRGETLTEEEQGKVLSFDMINRLVDSRAVSGQAGTDWTNILTAANSRNEEAQTRKAADESRATADNLLSGIRSLAYGLEAESGEIPSEDAFDTLPGITETEKSRYKEELVRLRALYKNRVAEDISATTESTIWDALRNQALMVQGKAYDKEKLLTADQIKALSPQLKDGRADYFIAQLNTLTETGEENKAGAALTQALINSERELRGESLGDKEPRLTLDLVKANTTEGSTTYQKWANAVLTLEESKRKKTESDAAAAWRKSAWEGEKNLRLKAEGKSYNAEKLLTADFLETAPTGVDESEKRGLQSRIDSITADENRRLSTDEENYYWGLFGNTLAFVDGKLEKGKDVLEPSMVWNARHLSYSQKMALYTSVKQLYPSEATKESGSTKDFKNEASDVIKNGAQLVAWAEAGQGPQTWYYPGKDGKMISQTLTKDNARSTWNSITNGLLALGAPQDAQIDGKKIFENPSTNPLFDSVDKFVSAIGDVKSTSPYKGSQTEAQEWWNSWKQNHPTATGKEVDEALGTLKEKVQKYNLQASFSLNPAVTNSTDNFASFINSGKAKLYMGKRNGMNVPMHPALKAEFDAYSANLAAQVAARVPGLDAAKVVPRFTQDGQAWVELTTADHLVAAGFGETSPTYSGGMRNDVPVKGKDGKQIARRDVSRIAYTVALVDGQATLIREVFYKPTVESNGKPVQQQALPMSMSRDAFNGTEWKSVIGQGEGDYNFKWLSPVKK